MFDDKFSEMPQGTVVSGESTRKRHRIEPGSEEWIRLWTEDPATIARGLDPADRHDPLRNPCHPYAESWPPGVPRAWPLRDGAGSHPRPLLTEPLRDELLADEVPID